LKNLRSILALTAVFTLLGLTSGHAASSAAGSDSNESLIAGNSQKNSGDKEKDEQEERNSSKNETPCGDRDDREHSALLLARAPGISVPERATLLSAVSIVNRGKLAAERVEVTSIRLAGAKLTTPLPVNLGTIVEDGGGIIFVSAIG